MNIQQIPLPEGYTNGDMRRVETGPLRIGDACSGLFIRGDDCFAFSLALNAALDRDIFPAMTRIIVEQLAKLLEATREGAITQGGEIG